MTQTRRTLLAALPLAVLALAGCGGGSGIALDNALFTDVTRSAAIGAFTAPQSSVPNATGTMVYFVATGAGGQRGVFQAPGDGSSAPTALFVGAPFVAPVDLVLSGDGATLYVADPQASGGGAVFALPVAGGTPVAVAGTVGTAPVALDLRVRSGVDTLYVVGGSTVYAIPAAGGTPTTIHAGSPLIGPTGIVAAADGALYVTDSGAVRKLAGGSVTTVASGVSLGAPAGIALTPDEAALAVSTFSDAGKSQVLTLHRTSGARSIFNRSIGINAHPGGLHGGRDAAGATGVYSWADATDGSGGVFRLRR